MKLLKPFNRIPKTKIPILLAEDHANFRKSLKMSVELEGDISVIGEAKNGSEAVSLTLSQHPEVVVMDIAMPILNGIQATRQIMKMSPSTRVLMLSANADPEYIEHAMLIGASGYLIKQCSTQLIAQAIREIIQGRAFFCKTISQKHCAEYRRLFEQSELLKKTLLN